MSSKVEQAPVLAQAEKIQSELVELRRHIHKHPELSFEENETGKLVAAKMSKLGYRVRPGVGGTGVVAEIGSGRTVCIRADMDALPITEDNPNGYCSSNTGVMHACGHDVHTACGLGAAMLIAANPPKNGCVRFLFQPAEEMVNDDGKSGATLMIEQGCMDGADAVFALHVDPKTSVGQIKVKDGAMLAACDTFEISIKGKPSHGAYPQHGIDTVVLAAQAVQAIQTVISRRKSALEPAVLTFGGIKSTTYRPNIVAEEVQLIGTSRYFDDEIGELIFVELKKALSIVEAMGGSYTVKRTKDNPAVMNDPQLTNLVRSVGARLLGKDGLIESNYEMGAEDFSFMSQVIPGSFFFLGTKIEDSPRAIHTPTFDIDERAIPLGAALLAECARQFLGE
ncbi:MAG: amidohydrolase [Leptolyngbya sp.]|nr:amidohydrolase [Candidatus Melainabacteria bacterium]